VRELFAVAVIGIAVCFSSGTAAQYESQREAIHLQRTQGKPPSTNLNGVPSDYRRRAAEIIKSRTNYRIRDGQISRPFVMWAGIFAGGNLPGVCALIFRENPFGSVVRDTWQITFKDGAVATAGYANIACDNTSKFHEVLGR
jgi:hypothetical protein